MGADFVIISNSIACWRRHGTHVHQPSGLRAHRNFVFRGVITHWFEFYIVPRQLLLVRVFLKIEPQFILID